MDAVFLPCGDRALTVQLGTQIDAAVNARVVALAEALAAQPVPGITDIVPTYCALLLCYDPEVIRGAALEAWLRGQLAAPARPDRPARLWEVPCLYGGPVGQDLEAVAEAKGLTPEAVIALHAGAEFRVYMIGFAPGFAYLGGLPEALHMPRLAVPRQHIAAGAIGIGGRQASINSVPGPSGWRFIGRTPLRAFDPRRAEPFLFRAGDRIRFRPVTGAEARDLDARIAAGEAVASPVTVPMASPMASPAGSPA